jgi:hypothetical protein
MLARCPRRAASPSATCAASGARTLSTLRVSLLPAVKSVRACKEQGIGCGSDSLALA